MSGVSCVIKDFSAFVAVESETNLKGNFAVYQCLTEPFSIVSESSGNLSGNPAVVPYTLSQGFTFSSELFRPALSKIDSTTLGLFCTDGNQFVLYTAEFK